MKIFITGATGFIGKRLVERLLIEGGHELICAGRLLKRLGPLLNKVKPIYLDIEDEQFIADILKQEKPDVIFHCAAIVSNQPLDVLQMTNVEGTRNLFRACLKQGIKKVVYLSSVAVISGNDNIPLIEDLPYKATNPYGKSKIEAEKIAFEYRSKGLKVAILRPAAVYGEGEPHLLPLLIKLIRRRLLLIPGDGSSKFHLVCLDNVVDVMMLCLSREEMFEGSYLIADKEVLTVEEVFGYIAEILKVRQPIYLPPSFIYPLTFLPFIGKRASFFLKDRVYSIERLEKRLGYTPRVSVYEGLKKAVLSYVRLDR